MAIAEEISCPNSSRPPKETPTPIPSAKECAVITHMIKKTLRKFALLKPSSWCSSPSSWSGRKKFVAMISTAPITSPTAVRARFILPASQTKPTLAPSISPAAMEFPMPRKFLPIVLTKKNGTTPNPVQIAVTLDAIKTYQTETSTSGTELDRRFAIAIVLTQKFRATTGQSLHETVPDN